MSDWTLFGDITPELDHPVARRCVNDPTLAIDNIVEANFWASVIRSAQCWWWVGAVSTPDGYGRVTWRRDHRQRTLSAHRFALTLTHGELAEAAVAEHKCNHPLCVRVGAGHVQASTQKNNNDYAVALGRHQGPRPTTVIDRAPRSQALRAWLLAGGNPDHVPTYLADDIRPSASEGQTSLF